MPRFRLHIAYDGTEFHGWQRQEPPGAAPLRTVQGVVEGAVSAAMGAPTRVQGASRTDAGVHARHQVAAFTAECRIPEDRLALAISARLPEDVQVLAADRVRDDFDPSVHCTSKGYRYRVRHGVGQGVGQGVPPPLFDRRWTWFTFHALDLPAMRRAAPCFEGSRDFRAVTSADHGRETTTRTVHSCRVHALRDHDLLIDVSGPGFLYNMVRIIAGTIVEAGRGRIDPASIPERLASLDRTRMGATLPAHGLCLEWIHVDPSWRIGP